MSKRDSSRIVAAAGRGCTAGHEVPMGEAGMAEAQAGNSDFCSAGLEVGSGPVLNNGFDCKQVALLAGRPVPLPGRCDGGTEMTADRADRQEGHRGTGHSSSSGSGRVSQLVPFYTNMGWYPAKENALRCGHVVKKLLDNTDETVTRVDCGEGPKGTERVAIDTDWGDFSIADVKQALKEGIKFSVVTAALGVQGEALGSSGGVVTDEGRSSLV